MNRYGIREIIKEDLTYVSSCICNWGITALYCDTYPQSGEITYRIISNQKEIYRTNNIDNAISEYNKLTK